jgi:hypothetical protein
MSLSWLVVINKFYARALGGGSSNLPCRICPTVVMDIFSQPFCFDHRIDATASVLRERTVLPIFCIQVTFSVAAMGHIPL